MALLTAADVRAHVETPLDDVALQRIIDRLDADMILRAGPHSGPITEVLAGATPSVFLGRPVASLTSVREGERIQVSTPTLDLSLDLSLWADEGRIERRPAAACFASVVEVVYDPVDDPSPSRSPSSPPTSATPATDLVVLDLSTSTSPDTRRVTVLLLQGQPAATPLDPVLIQTESRYMLPLARIVVPANANSITNSDIVDLRAFSQPVSGGAPNIPLAALLQNIRDDRALICFSDLAGLVSTTAPWDLGMQASTNGSAAIFSATTISGGIVTLKTGTTFNSQAFVGTLSRASIDVTRNPYFACRIKPDAGGSTLFAQGWGWNSQIDPGNYILFVWHRAIFRSSTTGNLLAVTSNGATETTTDLGAVYTLGVEATFEIESMDGGTTWLFRIDGVVVATHTTDVPTINLYTTVGIQSNSIGGTNHQIDKLDFVYSHQDRS